MATPDNATAEQIIKHAERVITQRGVWESLWQETAQLVWPAWSETFQMGGFDNTQGGGRKKTEHQFDATAPGALVKFAAIMESLNTPSGSKWSRLVPSDPVLMRNRGVRLWFEEASTTLHKYRSASKANFQSQNQGVWMSTGLFGTGIQFIDKPAAKDGPGLRYRCLHLGESYLLANHQGIIDTLIRKFKLTARQAAQKFGMENLPQAIQKCFENNGDTEKEFVFFHCVKPREDVDPKRIDYKGMPFASYYVSETQKHMVQEGGYTSFPAPTNRYWVGPGEVYARGPAILALPDIKTLNEQERTMLKQGHRAVDPILLIADDGMLDSVNLRPGAQNFGGVNADGKLLVQTLPTGDFQVAKELIQDKRKAVQDPFLISLFQILVENPQMTATEVVERAREKGMLLAPTAGRTQSEYLGPMITREVDLLAEQGLLPPMPQMLLDAQGEYEIEYDSPMARLQKAEESAGTMRTIQWASEIANVTQDPSVMDQFNFDAIIPDLAESNAMPIRHMASPDQIAAKRAQREQAMQAQTMKDVLPGVAGLAKAAGAPA